MLLAFFLVSCDALLDLILDDDTNLDSDQFYALNLTNNRFYKVRAKILYEGKKCIIWAENDSGVNEATAKRFADKYDDLIRKRIVDAFGMKKFYITDNATQYNFDDILDYANWLAGKENRKLTILLLDIKDGLKDPEKDPYVAGYFYSGNFNPRNEKNSNGCDMIYVDTYPGLDPVLISKKPQLEQQTYATLAHELQHLINFATTTLKRQRPMDTWIDEGLSSQAEQIYYEGTIVENIFDGNIIEHCKRINNSETIAKGNNFFVWGNHSENNTAILDEYSTVYLFFRWLYLRANNTSIFLDIETSKSSDHTVITDVAKNINPAWADWDVLLRSWLAANYWPENANYGYKNNYFKNIKVKPIKTTDNKISLAPGEGVYSRINRSFSTPSPSGNIHYAGLPGSNSGIVTQGSINSGVLLTYNANTNNKATAETGSLTGVSANVSTPGSRMVIDAEQTHTGPYVIDARDLSEILERNK